MRVKGIESGEGKIIYGRQAGPVRGRGAGKAFFFL